ncbi:MAG: kinase/pyrophosphorylase [Alphaproteobacteria bacterium]|nr:kinase/pyrophosphorylase [Alphaproteobacteria bacterium]
MADQDTPHQLFIISDGTGDTANKVVRACLLQFDGVPVAPRTFPNVTDAEQLRRLFQRAAEERAMVVTTLVRGEQRAEAERLAQKYRLSFVDVVGAMLGSMSDYLRVPPTGMPGLMHRTDQSYYRRIAAVEFTVKADDGKEPRMLAEADIVLVGVSRTSKTPLSVYLAHKGYKVGNVPMVLDRPVPEPLWDVDPRRIFALTIDPSVLSSIRTQRLSQMRMSDRTNYCQMDYILAELDYAHDLFSRNREWPVIDVTDKAVEETAAIILKILAERGLTDPVGEAGQL